MHALINDIIPYPHHTWLLIGEVTKMSLQIEAVNLPGKVHLSMNI